MPIAALLCELCFVVLWSHFATDIPRAGGRPGICRYHSTLDLTISAIRLKLQAFVNNPRRTQDLEDIKALIAANRQALKMDEVREYFQLFNREALLEEILK